PSPALFPCALPPGGGGAAAARRPPEPGGVVVLDELALEPAMDAPRPPEAARVVPHPAIVVLRGVERDHRGAGEVRDHPGGRQRLLARAGTSPARLSERADEHPVLLEERERQEADL